MSEEQSNTKTDNQVNKKEGEEQVKAEGTFEREYDDTLENREEYNPQNEEVNMEQWKNYEEENMDWAKGYDYHESWLPEDGNFIGLDQFANKEEKDQQKQEEVPINLEEKKEGVQIEQSLNQYTSNEDYSQHDGGNPVIQSCETSEINPPNSSQTDEQEYVDLKEQIPQKTEQNQLQAELQNINEKNNIQNYPNQQTQYIERPPIFEQEFDAKKEAEQQNEHVHEILIGNQQKQNNFQNQKQPEKLNQSQEQKKITKQEEGSKNTEVEKSKQKEQSNIVTEKKEQDHKETFEKEQDHSKVIVQKQQDHTVENVTEKKNIQRETWEESVIEKTKNQKKSSAKQTKLEKIQSKKDKKISPKKKDVTKKKEEQVKKEKQEKKEEKVSTQDKQNKGTQENKRTQEKNLLNEEETMKKKEQKEQKEQKDDSKKKESTKNTRDSKKQPKKKNSIKEPPKKDSIKEEKLQSEQKPPELTVQQITMEVIKEAQKERIFSTFQLFAKYMKLHNTHSEDQKRVIIDVFEEIQRKKKAKYNLYHILKQYFSQYQKMADDFHEKSYKVSRNEIKPHVNKYVNIGEELKGGFEELLFLRKSTGNDFHRLRDFIQNKTFQELDLLINTYLNEMNKITSFVNEKKKKFLQKEELLKKRVSKLTKVYTKGREGKSQDEDVFIQTLKFIKDERSFREALIVWGKSIPDLKNHYIKADQKLSQQLQELLNNFKKQSNNLYSIHNEKKMSKILPAKQEIKESMKYQKLCTLMDSDYIKYTMEVVRKKECPEVKDKHFESFLQMGHFELLTGQPVSLLRGTLSKAFQLKNREEELINTVSGNLVLYNKHHVQFKDKFIIKNISAQIVAEGVVQIDQVIKGIIFDSNKTVRIAFKDNDRAEEFICFLTDKI